MKYAASIALILELAQSQITSQSCMSCAGGSNYFCVNPGQFTNPWEVQCCSPGDVNANCITEVSGSKCSGLYSSNISSFYEFCPKQTQASCGLEGNYAGLIIYASNTKKTFTYDGLKYNTATEATASYGVCSYQVMNPPGGYKGGKIYVTFP